MVAQASVKNHVARCGERVYCLFYRNGFVEGEECSRRFQILLAMPAAHDDQGRGVRMPMLPNAAPLVIMGSRHRDRKSTRLNSSHSQISYAVFCLKKKKD